MLKAEHIRKCYGSFTAVEDVSFELKKGQILGLLGRNGAGKSSIMNVLTGYLAPTSGRVLWNGEDIDALGPVYRAELGYLPEIPPLYPALTVEETLESVCGLKRVNRSVRKKHIDEICERVCIGDRKKQLIRNLSKGYRQRVGLAQALIGAPSLLILDEPMVGLDPEQIVAIREIIRTIGKDHAVILSSHILSEIESLCDSLLIVRKGRVVASGSIGEIARQARPEGCRLRIRARGDGIEAALGVLAADARITSLPERESGYEEYLVETPVDVTALVPDLLASRGIALRMLYPMDADLEDVFLNLTKEEGETC